MNKKVKLLSKNYLKIILTIEKLIDLLVILVIFGFFIFSLYRLDFDSLFSYDEAWYGSIAKNILKTNNYLFLQYNGAPYYDHPPLIIWLMSFIYRFFGVSEFSTRILSVLSGTGCLLLIYFLGKKWFNQFVGFLSVIMLSSSLWFIIRTRSGNVDIPLTFISLLTVFFASCASKNRKFIIPSFFFLSMLIMSKSSIFVTYLPIFIFFLIPQIKKFNFTKRYFYLGLLLMGFIVIPWYLLNLLRYPLFLHQHFLTIGLRLGVKTDHKFLITNLNYLRAGVGRWFKLILISLISFFFLKKIKNRNFTALFIWITFLGIPLLFSQATEIRHMIPLFPPLFILTAFFLDFLLSDGVNFLWKFISQKRQVFLANKITIFLKAILLITIITIAIFQFINIFPLAIPPQKTVSLEADISQKAKKYQGNLVLKEVFLPVAVFYSEKTVTPLGFYKDAFSQMVYLLKFHRGENLFIIRKDELQSLLNEKVNFTILEGNNLYFLIR